MKPESALFLAPSGVLRTLLERTAGVVGQDFFRHLVRTLAVTLDTEYAFVTSRKPQDANRLLLVAGWHVNRAASGGSEFLIEGTPAARVLLEGQLWHEDGTASEYPKDRWLRKHGVRAYCAVAIPGLDSHAIGHIGVMSRQPFQASDELFVALRVLAARAAAELRRRRLDEMQRLVSMKFAAAFRTAPGIVGVCDLESGQFTDINQTVEPMLGYSPAEIVGRSAAELGIWEFPPEFAEILDELKLAGRIMHRDIHLLTRSGERRYGVFNGEIMEIDQRAYVLMNILDQTEYQGAISALQERENVYQALFSTGTNLVLLYRIDAEGRATGPFMDVNDSACQLLGYSRDELLGITPAVLSESKQWRTAGRKLLTESTVSFETSLRSKNYKLLPVEVHARLLMLEGRQTVMLVAHDMSSRKLQADALQDAERQYRAIFENAIEGIYQTTPDGRIISANPALARILGYNSPEEIIASGPNIASHVYVDSEQRAQLLRRIEQDSQYSDQEFQVFRRDGSTIWVSDNARVVRDAHGKVLYYEGTIQDITSRKRAEEALMKSEEQYRTLVDASQDGVFLSQGGIFVYVNRSFAHMLGYETEEIIGMPVTGIVTSENGLVAEQIASDAAAEGGMEPQEIRLLHQDGK
ncbi:MAG: PAS domain S-box protein, partial [Gammaproteobacteria bacterium]|nr:PAS domain S-box protein [Gammaproteobacteria bacterium]